MDVECDIMDPDALFVDALCGDPVELDTVLADLPTTADLRRLVLEGLRGTLDEGEVLACLQRIAALPGVSGWRALVAYQLLARSRPMVLAGIGDQEAELLGMLCRNCRAPFFRRLPGMVARGHLRASCGGHGLAVDLPLLPGAIDSLHLLAVRGEAGERLRHHRRLLEEAGGSDARIELLEVINDIVLGQPAGLAGVDERFDAIEGAVRSAYELVLPCAWLIQAFMSGIAISRADAEQRLVHGRDQDPFRRQQLSDFLRLPWAQADELNDIARKGHEVLLVTDDHDLFAFTPIRAAILGGDIDRAADLLVLRTRHLRETGFMEHLQWARIFLIDGDGDKAANHYRRALTQAEQAQAQGRLEFELRLSRELNTFELTRLLARAEQGPDEELEAVSDDELIESDRPVVPVPSRSEEALLLGRSEVMNGVRQRIQTFAASDLPVLVLGETGTGKDLAARAIHLASPRRDRPYIAVNCAAFNDSLLESELFGHVKGSYTGSVGGRRGMIAAAEDGTLFLDEIADTSPIFQAALLRLLENFEYRPVGSDRSHPMRCRIVTASNVDLDRAVGQGRFRADLFYRLQRLQLFMPSLRERVGDIPMLAQFFLDRQGRPGRSISKALATWFQEQEWPGNVRHLRNRIELLAISFPDKRVLDITDIENIEQDQTTSWHRRLRPRDDEREDESSSAWRALEPKWSEREGDLGHGTPQMARLARIRDLFREHRRLTRQQIIRALGVSQSTATGDLKQLIEEGLVEKVMPRPAPRTHFFRLCEPVPRGD